MEQVLSRADRLSAGMDRARQEEDAGDYMTARLLSAFSQIRFSENNGVYLQIFLFFVRIDFVTKQLIDTINKLSAYDDIRYYRL